MDMISGSKTHNPDKDLSLFIDGAIKEAKTRKEHKWAENQLRKIRMYILPAAKLQDGQEKSQPNNWDA